MLYLILLLISASSLLILSSESSSKFPPPLSKEEEYNLFEKLIKYKDKTAREKLILHNLRLVSHIVRKYYGGYSETDDLLSIGTVGLIKAIDTFKNKKGVKFATYAGKCIQNEILMKFRSSKKLLNEVSINEPIDTDKDGNVLTYSDIIGLDDTIADDIDKKVKIEKSLKYIKNKLNSRERTVIVLRYGLNNKKPLTQMEVAEKLNISRSYVSRIEKSALEKLKSNLIE